ncbi:MAG: molybdenum cofactor biosynthesis protein MoaB [Rhodothermaceae bacterium]|nr:molybdenum cofactor biosynthesis protein MoaB [Rhodothermaceae bacterium]MYF41310.1 molybdenum cofactor biosynthesis protein MoaB [Rhodothermaceae bacterium]MYI84982.1 molybdenum cofactor biosynthesis protein MoaB [Rhodothermaceae bacterium]
MSCHESNAPTILRFALITVSDTRKKTTDVSGLKMANLIIDDGHEITSQSIIPDEPTIIKEVIRAQSGSADVLCLSGGTGISRRDQTYEAVSALLDKPLPGFGELFRMLSWQQVGSKAMLSRAIAGIYGSLVVFALPGSPKAVVLAMEKLILPEARHIVSELRKH